MGEGYLEIDKFEDVIASTDVLALVSQSLKERPSNWKWIILAAQNGLQAAIVCALKDSSGTSILANPAEMLQWLDTQAGPMPPQKLANFLELLDRFSKEFPSIEITDKNEKHLRKLHKEFRNNLSHFVVDSISIELAGLPAIIETALHFIDISMQQERVWLTDEQRYRLTCNLATARAALRGFVGDSMTITANGAVEEKLACQRARIEGETRAKVEEIMALVREFGGSGGAHSSDHDDLYGEDGLPK